MTPLTLANFEGLVAARIVDASNLLIATATLDASIRAALHEYSARLPLATDAVVTCAAASREVNLSSLTGLIQVSEVWFPYSSTALEQFPPDRVHGFELIWDDGQPVLRLSSEHTNQPQTNDEIRVWYTKRHTIQNLDAAAVTTILSDHEYLITTGAAGFALQSRSIDLAEQITPNRQASALYMKQAVALLFEFREQLRLAGRREPSGPVFADGWRMDKWDRRMAG